MQLVPTPQVTGWLASEHADETFVTAVTAAELWFGVEQLPTGRRRDDLEARVQLVLDAFGPVIVSFDSGAARFFGVLAAKHPGMDVLDAEIAAIALAYGARLATRNTKRFLDCGVELIDPWAA
jgi:hypothetical protein